MSLNSRLEGPSRTCVEKKKKKKKKKVLGGVSIRVTSSVPAFSLAQVTRTCYDNACVACEQFLKMITIRLGLESFP